jgi:hypothetical protein
MKTGRRGEGEKGRKMRLRDLGTSGLRDLGTKISEKLRMLRGKKQLKINLKNSIMNSGNSEENTSKKTILFVATFAAFLTPFLGSAVNLALPSIGKDLHASAIGLGWVISSFMLSSAIFLLPFGRLADIIGRKKVFSAGILLFTVLTFL